jgi:hypothetical protein
MDFKIKNYLSEFFRVLGIGLMVRATSVVDKTKKCINPKTKKDVGRHPFFI